MKKAWILVLCLVLAVSLVVAGCGGGDKKAPEQKKIKMKMSVTTAESSPWTKGAQKFADIVKDKTKGRVTIQVFPNEQLSSGNQAKGIEQLQNGVTDLSFHSTIIYSVLDPKFSVISMPWIIPSNEAVDKAMKGAGGEKIKAILRAKGVEPLGFGENGFRQITNNKQPIATPADMEGLKIRIPGMKMYIDLFKALGADPTAMNFAEVFTALQQGTIDGQENPIPVIYTSKLGEVQKYMTIWNYSYDPLVLGINKKLFDSLDKETQQILRDAAKEACEYQIKLNREEADKQLAELKAKGMKVTVLTPAQIKAFQAKMGPVYEKYEPSIGKDLMDAFRNAGK
ncbi:DctP family TRAP transporter solute-binding subunit [Anaeroselena agilis]|uniref:DctP family TRAP transporter solute-binding subunit n=1 Tax=Anaeroselena agilis TaxID=3063788 RepID=A0ABU3NXX8_9FIRM|nr:DctP family TRAP transporter solute-binding subunit [Selenomonadales bacterium 4137-cl]